MKTVALRVELCDADGWALEVNSHPWPMYISPRMELGVKGEVTIGIERYVVFDLPVAEKEREKLQTLIKDNFAVLIDYWAVDWDYDGYTFKSQW